MHRTKQPALAPAECIKLLQIYLQSKIISSLEASVLETPQLNVNFMMMNELIITAN